MNVSNQSRFISGTPSPAANFAADAGTPIRTPGVTLFRNLAALGAVLWVLVASAVPVHGAIAIDATAVRNQSSPSTSITTPSFSTRSSNELLLAFIATDASAPGIQVTGVSGAGGLTWVLVRRTNVQLGTSEIWRAFAPTTRSNVTVRANLSQRVAASLTVVTFSGVDPSGTNGSGAVGATGSGNANPGAPTASLVSSRPGSWVFGVGNDWDRAQARTVPTDQTMVNQYLATTGDTFWVQRQSSTNPASATTVTINDTAPATDRYNLTLAEILPPVSVSTYSISGSVTPASLGSGAVVALTQNGNAVATATVDSTGTYLFAAVPNGTYDVNPAKSGVAFSPTGLPGVTVNGAALSLPPFTATASIIGTITPATAGAGSLVTLSGPNALSLTATANASGVYSFTSLSTGSYTVTPNKAGFTFSPASQPITISSGSVTANFTATAVTTYSITGSIAPASGGSGTLLTLSGTAVGNTTADASGTFSFTGLNNGSYTITPSKSGFSFTPASQAVTINGSNVSGVAFAASATAPPPLNYPDLSDIIPTGQISVVGTGSSRVLQYTHDTYNGGSGPLVIQPSYNPASGTYQGTQYIYQLSGGTWSVAQQIPLAGAFVFSADHAHFHFPFTMYGLYSVAPGGGIGAPVAVSPKIEFCINDSFIYSPALPNAGALGNLGPCTDPTSLRGLDIGAVDEYDQTDPGQNISLANVPDGTYWFRAIVDPDNFFSESDKSNNETDVLLTIAGNSVTAQQLVSPVLPAPPVVSWSAPADLSTVSGSVALSATTGTGAPVQFLLDGQPLGAPVAASPYELGWDTTTVPNGVHWLAAQSVDPSSGRTGTSSVARLTVSNAGTSQPPVVTVTGPASGTTVSATVIVSATVADSAAITGVQFYVDGVAIGPPLTAPPYLAYWDTVGLSQGQHQITATATDALFLTGTSAPVTVTVDNSHPANLIGIDATVFSDAGNTMTTPAFSTTTASDLLVAFVAYDGPSNAPQTATVSGAGLTWTLLKRSNVQHGTSEIWVAKASTQLSNATVLSQPGVTGYHGSLVVVAFTNASGPGVVGQASAPSGAPDIYLPGVAAGSWVFAVGNDWDNAVTRSPSTGQVLVHQRLDSSTGDTYWVQSTAAPSTVSGLVDIHDDAPTADQWNYAAVEIVATRQ
ncbi:Ig-like domain-containing protein [Geomesophilobacter sediminis]|uniref:Uncharacterized protein n=1 Tax=Geomesophilobacter sediminis TaxID=2798584 RepID=A0A8J7J2M0_9BACT|nr:Ig-like domain-containing protein [Geomesophilobacter sediminis]MBJ6725023.1 hypothetical protein [Geomesophilobacter sediminis]